MSAPETDLQLPDGDLDGARLAELVTEIAARPELWSHLVRHDAEQRISEQVLAGEHVGAWLICWMDEHDTGFHDHDTSGGAVAVVSGQVREERMTFGGPPRVREFRAGQSFHFSAADIHRVTHAGAEPAVTLHVYSPPLQRMGAYATAVDGTLVRYTQSWEEELRPLG
jgi:predicted metal-dependent enzyme (double-stranded beta helix superfamily)